MASPATPTTAPLPRSFRLIRLELAREPGHPEGDAGSGYRIVAPLAADGRLDPSLWRDNREACRVVRFRRGEPDETGHLRHRPGGSWAFAYDDADEGEDTGYRLETERFILGEYVSIRQDGTLHTYRVVAVDPV